MSNYFGYILEESIPQDYEDPNDIYNEMDTTMCEFDSYVQEGVGLKVLIGAGIAVALSGLIALILKLFSDKSEANVSTECRKALSIYEQAKNAGVKQIVLNIYPKRDFFSMTNGILDMTEILSDELENFLTHVAYPETKASSIEEIQSKCDDIIRSRVGCSLEEFLNNFETMFNNSVEAYRGTDIDTAGGFVKELNKVKNDFKGMTKALYNIQDKYKKLKANNPAYDKYENYFVNKIDGLRALLKQLGDSVIKVLKAIEDSMLYAIKHKDDLDDFDDVDFDEPASKKRVDVKDIMDGKVGFNDVMSDKNTVLHFS